MRTIPHPELERWRSEFPILSRRNYLNSCSLGALSRRSMDYLEEYQELWNGMGASAWYDQWTGRLAELRGRVAQLWNAAPTEVALMPSVSAALSSVASAVDYRWRNRVVVAELDFPTQIYQWMVKPGVEVVRVPSDDGVSIAPERWAEYVDERTALVATSHVFYTTGYIQDLPRIAEVARGAGALFIVDGYHGAGQLPVDPRAAGADVYLAGPLKWLLGGPGMAFLWAKEERIAHLEPTIVSWFGARDQFLFQGDRFAYRDDAARFELGTPSVPTMYTALGGLEIILEVGGQRIRERVSGLAEDLIARARQGGFELRIARQREQRSGIIMLAIPGAAEVVRRLGERGIIVDYRGEFVRVSPHFYNTTEDNAQLMQALMELTT